MENSKNILQQIDYFNFDETLRHKIHMNFNDSNIQNLCKTQNIHHRLDIAMDQLQSGYENFVQYYASLAITNEVLYMYGSEIKDELINIPWFGESSLYFDNYQ